MEKSKIWNSAAKFSVRGIRRGKPQSRPLLLFKMTLASPHPIGRTREASDQPIAMAATKLPELAVPDFKEHLPQDLLTATADGLLKGKTFDSQNPVARRSACFDRRSSTPARTFSRQLLY